MTKGQALALVNALEQNAVPCSATLTFPAGGGEAWAVSIPDTYAITGPQIAALAQYCAAQGLTFSATFSYLGVT